MPAQNLDLIDRALRFFIGVSMLDFGYFTLEKVEYVSYGLGVLLLSEYPLMTAILGWDPFYMPMIVGHNPELDERLEYLCETDLPLTDNGKRCTVTLSTNSQDSQRNSANLGQQLRPKS